MSISPNQIHHNENNRPPLKLPGTSVRELGFIRMSVLVFPLGSIPCNVGALGLRWELSEGGM